MTTVRQERKGDRAAIGRVVTAAFGRKDEARLVEALRASDAWVPELSLVAEEGRTAVGYVALTRASIRTVGGDVGLLALAPLAVAPDWQRRGIGGQLVQQALQIASARGERGVVLVGHPSYYPRFGFVPAAPLGLTSVFAQGEHAPAFQVRELKAGALTGVEGPVLYALAFDAFA
ncbi:MAG: N-acetyltransferase [Vicinamibacteria bacterium]